MILEHGATSRFSWGPFKRTTRDIRKDRRLGGNDGRPVLADSFDTVQAAWAEPT
jgi:hypothetical protein